MVGVVPRLRTLLGGGGEWRSEEKKKENKPKFQGTEPENSF